MFLASRVEAETKLTGIVIVAVTDCPQHREDLIVLHFDRRDSRH